MSSKNPTTVVESTKAFSLKELHGHVQWRDWPPQCRGRVFGVLFREQGKSPSCGVGQLGPVGHTA